MVYWLCLHVYMCVTFSTHKHFYKLYRSKIPCTKSVWCFWSVQRFLVYDWVHVSHLLLNLPGHHSKPTWSRSISSCENVPISCFMPHVRKGNCLLTLNSYEVQIMWPHHSSVRGRSDKITFFLIHPQSWSLYFPTNDDVSNGIMWGNLMD